MDEKIALQDLADMLARRYGMSREEAAGFIKDFFVLIEKALLADSYVKVKGLGTFRMVDVEGRESVDVNTGQRIEIAPHRKVSFSPEKELKDLVNKPFSHFETVVLNDNVTFADEPPSEASAPSAPDEDEEVAVSSSVSSSSAQQSAAGQEAQRPAVSPPPVSEPPVPPVSEPSLPVSGEQEPVRRASLMPKVFAAVVAVVVVVCLSLIASLYWSDGPHSVFGEQQSEALPYDDGSSLSAPSAPDVLPADTSSSLPADTVVLADTIRPDAVPVPSPSGEKKQAGAAGERKAATAKERQAPAVKEPESRVVPISTGYRITGTRTTHVLKKGETLTQVSLRYYGTKALWPYIVKANRSAIKNPNNVPLGTKLKIPELEKE